jgi:hypothetical protein
MHYPGTGIEIPRMIMGADVSELSTDAAGEAARLGMSIVLPMLNEAAGLPGLHERLDAMAQRLRAAFGLRTEVVYVDDGSTDDTLAVASRLPNKNLDVQVVSLSRNFG